MVGEVEAIDKINSEYIERLKEALGVDIGHVNQDRTACDRLWAGATSKSRV